MFCPNCGKDCADANFCPKCGTQLQQAVSPTVQSVWSVGMPCPQCGGTKLEGNNCAFCGAQLIVDIQTNEDIETDSYEIPFRGFKATYDMLYLEKDCLIIAKTSFLLSRKIKIPYESLTEAMYCCTEEWVGSLTFHWNNSLPSENGASINDVSIKLVGEDHCAFFYHIFYLIYYLSPSSVRFITSFPSVEQVCLKYIGNPIDINDYFDRFNPKREIAVAALEHDKMLLPKEARVLIDALFNARQKELYEANPRLAIRDYNRMMKERYRRYDEEKQKRDANRARRRY